MIHLYDTASMKPVGEISEQELQFLISNLEEEGAGDQDYYIDRPTLDFLAENGITDHLKQIIQGAMGDQDGVELVYKRE